jgi:transposase
MKTIKQVIGIDVSKDTFHVCFGSIDETQSIKIVKQSSFTNNEKGFKQLLSWKQKNLNSDIYLYYVMEATGVYYENLAYFLSEKGEHISVLLPNKSKSFSKSLDIKTKTDKVDAAMLCRIGLERVLPIWKIPTVLMKQIKSLCREYKSLKVDGAKIKVRLHAYKHSYKPEKRTISRLKQQLSLIEKQIMMVEKEIQCYIIKDEALQKRVNNIQQVKGLSMITIITVIAETNGFASITSAKQLTSYSGLDITMNQSGQFYGRTKISKKGNSHIRTALYLPAMSAVRYNIRLKQFYENIMQKHKCGKVGIVAVARKMLVLIYTLWKNETIYDPMLNVEKIY